MATPVDVPSNWCNQLRADHDFMNAFQNYVELLKETLHRQHSPYEQRLTKEVEDRWLVAWFQFHFHTDMPSAIQAARDMAYLHWHVLVLTIFDVDDPERVVNKVAEYVNAVIKKYNGDLALARKESGGRTDARLREEKEQYDLWSADEDVRADGNKFTVMWNRHMLDPNQLPNTGVAVSWFLETIWEHENTKTMAKARARANLWSSVVGIVALRFPTERNNIRVEWARAKNKFLKEHNYDVYAANEDAVKVHKQLRDADDLVLAASEPVDVDPDQEGEGQEESEEGMHSDDSEEDSEEGYDSIYEDDPNDPKKNRLHKAEKSRRIRECSNMSPSADEDGDGDVAVPAPGYVDSKTEMDKAYTAHIHPFLRKSSTVLSNDNWYVGDNAHNASKDKTPGCNTVPDNDPNQDEQQVERGYSLTFLCENHGGDQWQSFIKNEEDLLKRGKDEKVNEGYYFDPERAWRPDLDTGPNAIFESLRKATIDAHYERLVADAKDAQDEANSASSEIIAPGPVGEARKKEIRDMSDKAKHDLNTLPIKRAAELESHEGDANRIFVWRLVVVHLRILRQIGTSHVYLPVTSSFDMDLLVDNVSHMIKYRRCIKNAKCMYKSVFKEENSLHHQYRAKILNVKHAHHHQDESNTDIGVARRIIRQAQVANFQNYYCKELSAMDPKETPDDSIQDQYRKAEHYFTNPPMAPIMCAAPPRMGKSALSWLMVSFASKMGAHVQYGVSPNKVVPRQDVKDKFASLKWKAHGMRKVNVYSQDNTDDVANMNFQIHKVADMQNEWTFHVRDEAQTLIKGKQAPIGRELEASFPMFYGLTMCVSATLLPVFMAGQMVGSIDSVRNLLKVKVAEEPTAAAPKYIVSRGAIEKTILMQDWSFPIAPDFLAPPRGAFPASPDTGPHWYKEYYETGANEAVVPRTTNYHGTSFYVTQWRGKDGPEIMASKLLVDHSLVASKSELSKTTRQLKQKAVKENPSEEPPDLDLPAAYNKYLAQFNKLNRRHFDAGLSSWVEDAPTRIVNEPIAEVSIDAARMLEQAQEWLGKPSQPEEVSHDGGALFHPMLIMAPVSEANEKNGRKEWAVLLCKMAWLRFNADWDEDNSRVKSLSKEALKNEYGVAVLVYTYDVVDPAAFEDKVCARPDFAIGGKGDTVVSVVFDPTLPENRFPEQVFEWPDDTDGSDPRTRPHAGTMLKSTLIPTLLPEDYESYTETLRSSEDTAVDKENLAEDWLRKNMPLKVYNFKKTSYYKVNNTVTVDVDRVQSTGDYDEEYGSDDEDFYDNDDEGDDGAAQGHSSSDDKANPEPEIADVNAIALRLCVHTHKHAQAAAEFLVRCNVVKIAALGYSMFKAGLTLQSTVSHGKTTHMFVPRYMSFALSEANRGPDLSYLYQLVGRGFVDLKTRILPKGWKLELLSKKSFHQLIEDYGNAELLVGMVHNESLAGRIMTLGATLWNANSKMGQVYDASPKRKYIGGYTTRRLKGEDPKQSLTKVLFGLSMPSNNPSTSFTTPSETPRDQRVFGTVRKCLTGENKPQSKSWFSKSERENEFLYDKAFQKTKLVKLKRYENEHEKSHVALGRSNQGGKKVPSCDEEDRNDGYGVSQSCEEYYHVPTQWWFEQVNRSFKLCISNHFCTLQP